MIFRVMRENEIEDKGLGKGIYSKKFNLDYYNLPGSFGSALDNISTHILNGNHAVTEYISCSKDFCLDLKKYATEQLNLRPYLAIVFNHDESVIESDMYDSLIEKLDLHDSIYRRAKNGELTLEEYKNLIAKDKVLSAIYEDLENSNDIHAKMVLDSPLFYVKYPEGVLNNLIIRMSQSEVKKMVIDASTNIYTDKIYSSFFEKGLIFNKSGYQKEKFNYWEYGTARNSSEVIVLNHISCNDIKILNPLQYDILYALLNNYSIHNITNEIIQMLDLFKEENYLKIRNLFQDSKELLVFDCLYVERNSILSACETKNVFNNAILYKEIIVRKCIQYLNYKLNKKYYCKYAPAIERVIKLNDCPGIELQGDKILKKSMSK